MKINLKLQLTAFFLVAGIFITINANAQVNRLQSDERTSKPLLDSAYQWAPDSNNIWQYVGKTVKIAYDANDNEISYLYLLWNGTAWAVNSRDTFIYDANNNLIGQEGDQWSNNAWVPNYRYINTYNANNFQTSGIFQTWVSNAWKNLTYDTITYDANKNITSYLSKSPNGNSWVNYGLELYTYDINNNRLTDTSKTWNSAWYNRGMYTYAYNVNNRQILSSYYEWVNNSAFKIYSKDTSTYDANDNELTSKTLLANGSNWVNSDSVTNTYDINNNRLTSLDQKWVSGMWTNNNFYKFTDNNYHQLLSEVWQSWSNGSWANQDSFYNYYGQTSTALNTLPLNNEQLSVYPNPSIGKLTVNLDGNSYTSLKVVDELGKEIYAQPLSASQKNSTLYLNLSNTSNGIYFLQLQTDKGIISKKIEVQR